jgi:FMN phosphatase YigB (HAD superfamily)
MSRIVAPDKVTAVLFDWDLTLARALGEVSESERLAALFRSQGLTFTAEEVQIAMNAFLNRIRPELLAQNGGLQTRRDIINSYYQILGHLGYKKRGWGFGNRLYDAHGNLPTFLYDDVKPLLESLKRKGLTLGIISNHSHSARKMIERNLAGFISPEQITISQEVGTHKPAKTIFRHALARLKEPPAQCLFVGNNLVVDAIGAVENGGFGRGLWLDREEVGAGLALPRGVFRITSLSQVPAFLL